MNGRLAVEPGETMEFLFGFGVGVSLGASLGVLMASLLRMSKDLDWETGGRQPDQLALRKEKESHNGVWVCEDLM